MMPSSPDQDSVDAALVASSAGGDSGLRAADLRARSRGGSEQEQPPGARSLIVELRERLAATERSLDAERVTSRQARMRAEALSAELERRLVGEDELRGEVRSLTALLTTTQRRLEETSGGPDAGDLAALRDERDEARAALSLTRDDLRALQAELERTRVAAATAARELEGARADAGAARSELDATARELEDARGELDQVRAALPPPAPDAAGEHDAVGTSTVELLRARLEGLVAPASATGVDGSDLVAGLAAAASRLRERPPTRGRLEPRAPIRPGSWMPDALSRLVASDRAVGERVLLGLLPAQSLSVRRPLTYLLEIEDGGTHRVALMAQGAAVGPATDAAADARVRGPLSALVRFVAGGLPARGHGLSLRRGRRLRPVLRARRVPLQLNDLAALLRAPDPELLLLLVCAAVAPQTIDRSVCVDVVVDEDAEPLRIVAAAGSAMRLVRPGDDAPAPDATLSCSAAALPDVLAGSRGAAVDGDLGAVLALLGWFDRAQECG